MDHRTRKCLTPAKCKRQWDVVVTNTGDMKLIAENREACMSEVLRVGYPGSGKQS